tara:strand:- start:220 stop:861 length:642 start_codon:yes stop_codon:yes gene_type:complete
LSAFTDYDNLVEVIGDWLARDDLSARIPDFIWLAESELQRDLGLRLNDSVERGSAIAGQEYIDLPLDFAEGILLRWDNQDLTPLTVSSFDVVSRFQKSRESQSTSSSSPRVGALHGQRIYIGPKPGDEAYTFFYRSGTRHLGPDNATNQLLRDYPDALLYGSLMHSAPYLGADERTLVWGQLLERAKESAKKQEWRSRTGYGPLRMQPDIGVR